MVAYILGIAKRSNKGITSRGRFQGLQIGARGITNRGSLRDFKSGQINFKLRQRLQIGAREITNRDRNLKSGQGLQIRAEQRAMNHSRRHRCSHLFKYCVEKEHKLLFSENFRYSYKKDKNRRKLAKSLLKRKRATLIT